MALLRPADDGCACALSVCGLCRLFAVLIQTSDESPPPCPIQNPATPTTLYDKIWNDHLVHEADDGTCLLYIDRHLVHEVTSPQAFEGLRATGRKVHAPKKTLAVVDHNVPTTDRSKPNPDPESIEQIAALAEPTPSEFGVTYYDEFDIRQGIVHVIGPEQGFTLPGTTSSAATATPRPMARSARWRTASAPPRSSTFWRRRR